jgi:flagellin
LAVNQSNAAKSMERLSSGLRINRAADDAAGLAISEKMRAQVRGLKQAARNAQDGISLIQTAEGALNETHAILQRMRELAVQASNDTLDDQDRAELQKEIADLLEEVDRIASDTQFNTKVLLDGSLAGTGGAGGSTGTPATGTATINEVAVTVTGGENEAYNGIKIIFAQGEAEDDEGASFNGTDTITVTLFKNKSDYTADEINNLIANIGALPPTDVEWNQIKVAFTGAIDGSSATGTITLSGGEAPTGGSPASGGLIFHIGANAGQSIQLQLSDMSAKGLGIDGINISSQSGANAAQNTLDNAIQLVSAERSKLGAAQNRLEHTISNLGTAAENLQAAESRIRDLDMAEEIMAFTKNNILQQAATAMLAQANMAPQSVLQLLG